MISTMMLKTTLGHVPDATEPALSWQNHAISPVSTALRYASGAAS